MKKILSLTLSLAVLAACAQKESAEPVQRGGQQVALTITVDYPQGDPDSKVAFDQTDNTKLVWTGDEKMTLIFGDTASETDKDNRDNPSLSSVAPGVFSGTITTPKGYDMTHLQGLVVPGVEGAAFLWNSTEDKRISMPIPAEQTQTEIGKPNWNYVPFFYDLSGTEMTQNTDGSYAFAEALTLKSACDLVAFNVHGKHAAMADDEVLKSVKLIPIAYGSTTKVIISGYSDWTLESTGTGLNSYGNDYIKVTLENQPKISDVSESGALVYASAIFGGTRYIGMVEVETDKGIYRKSFATPKSFPQKKVSQFNVFNVGLDLSTFDNESGLRYSVNASDEESWSAAMPEEFETLYVKTLNYIMTAEDLSAIKTAIDSQESPVSLDLSAAQYESYIFPATFAGASEDAPYEKLKSIWFPSNVTSVNKNAFKFCESLTSVNLDKITSIGASAFERTALTKLNLGNQITSLGQYAFANCYDLTEVYFNATDAGYAVATSNGTNTYAFQFDSGVEHTCDLTFTVGPDAYIGRYMFRRNTNLTKLVFEYTGESVRRMGNNSMIDTKNLKTVECKGATPNVWFYHGALKNVGVNHASAVQKQLIVPAGTTDAYAESRLYTGYAIASENVANPNGLQDFGFVIVEAAN